MPVNSTHPEYDSSVKAWSRARDVIAGEDAVKAAGERYVPRLEGQSDEEYGAYKARASFFNATARTAEGYVGLIFRRPPFIKLPESGSALGAAMAAFGNDADMLGTPLVSYAKNVVSEVISVGRAGTLVDWEAEVENRVYASIYCAESILNWRVERINGRNILTLVVLHEGAPVVAGGKDEDPFVTTTREQIRVLKLVAGESVADTSKQPYSCVVELWQREEKKSRREKSDWKLVETRVPLRLGKPLPLIPFVFHGPRHSQPGVEKLPLEDIITVNLDHYRLNADYKHGIHFTALPTAWVSGFDKSSSLRIGSSTAWVTETPGATAGFLEFTGQGLTTFERALDRDERLMAVLGSRLLEPQKRVGETAEAIELRQGGESSILGNIAVNVSASVTQVLRWAYWWNSTEDSPDDVTNEQVLVELNTDFSTKGLSAQEIQAVVSAWQANAISRETMTELFRRGEVLPEGRTNEEEGGLIDAETSARAGKLMPHGTVESSDHLLSTAPLRIRCSVASFVVTGVALSATARRAMRLRIAALVVIIVALAVVFALWPPSGLRQTLRDGSRLTLSSVKVGRTNTFTHGTLLSKTLGRLAPSNGLNIAGVRAQRPSKLTFPADDDGVMMVAELRLGRTSATNEWVVKFREPWRHRVVISGDDGFPHVQSVREFQQYPEGWCAYIFAHSFPRQSRSLRFRLEERNSFRDDWRLVTTFETRNPKRSRTEQWSTNKTVTVNAPNGVQAEIAEITVDLSTNANLPSEYIATFPVRFTQSGVVLTNWVIMNSTLTDATGNYGWLSGRSMWVPISDGWRMHRVRPLDPTVPWRLRFNFAQDADFPKTNLLSFSVTWPLAGTIYTNLAGKPMRIGFVNTYMLDVELMSKDSDVRLTFVSATDDSGADLDDSSGSWGQHSFWKSLKLRNTSKPVQIKATVAIHPNFTNEVILQPRFVSR